MTGWNFRATGKRPIAQRLVPIVCAVAMAISPPTMAQQNLFGNVLGGMQSTIDKIKQAVPGAASAPSQTVRPEQPGVSSAAQFVPKGKLAALFAKRTVTGKDLYDTLKNIRQQARERKNARAWSAFTVASDAAINSLQSGQGGNIGSTLTSTATELFATWTKDQVNQVGMKALDDHLQYLLDDRDDALSKESITLPTDGIQNEVQAQRIVTMAALVVAARISQRVMEKAKRDFESLKKDFAQILDERQKAAELLFAAIDVRRKAQRGTDAAALGSSESSLKASLGGDDIAFIDNDIGRLSLAEFSKDMAAQNLALKYLARENPKAFADYKGHAKDFVDRGRAYVRTMSGVAAFGGLSLTFVQTVSEVGREKNIDNMLKLLPLASDFVTAAGPLAKLAIETAVEGVTVESDSRWQWPKPKHFVVTIGDASPKQLNSAREVFNALKAGESSGADRLLQSALFSSEVRGFLAGVRTCDAGEAGRMLDAAVHKNKREEFASGYFGDAKRADGFSFLNVFEAGDAEGEKLTQEVLGKDHRDRSDLRTGVARGVLLAGLQKEVAEKYDNWGDEQLTRLIFANREGDALYATMQLGVVAVRPVPSMQSVYVYESQVDACRKSNDRDAGTVPDAAPKLAKKTK